MSSPSPYIYPAHLPLVQIKESTISKIELSQEELAELHRILQSKKISSFGKQTRQRKIVGICSCGQVPDYKVIRYYDGMQRIERYCASCLQKEKDHGNIKVNGNQ